MPPACTPRSARARSRPSTSATTRARPTRRSGRSRRVAVAPCGGDYAEADVAHRGVAGAAAGELVAPAVGRVAEVGAAALQSLRRPLPNVADHVVQTRRVRLVRVDRDRAGVAVREIAAERVAARVVP